LARRPGETPRQMLKEGVEREGPWALS